MKAFVAVAGFYRDAEAIKAADPDDFAQKIAQGSQARERYEKICAVEMMPAVALDRNAAMTMESSWEYFTRRAAHPNYANEFALMSREHFLGFDVQCSASKIT